jgi:uncharacterized membrane protein YccC
MLGLEPARLFGIFVGFVAVTVLQVEAFGESWPLALLYSALMAAGVIGYSVWAASRGR